MKVSAEVIEKLLPQTQCRQCGFACCAEYAKAIAAGEAKINRCATGGEKAIRRIAEVLGCEALPLDPEYGREMPLALAQIDPKRCIGCRICADRCPVAAITGLPKKLFSVLDSDCTGCALCVAACPVDAIDLYEPERNWSEEDASRAKAAFEANEKRKKRETEVHLARLEKAASEKKSLLSAVMARVNKGKNGATDG